MTIQRLYIWRIVCDGGCGAEIRRAGPDAGDLLTRNAAAGAAFAAGWAFVPVQKRSGANGERESTVCPACTPTFEPVAANDTWKNRRVTG